MVSYGLAYGMESYGLAQRLNIPVDEAAEILNAYFVAFPNVKEYMERTVAEARQRATPRRCSAVVGRSPSWRRTTTGSARRGSARP